MDVEVKVLISDEHWLKLKARIPVTDDEKTRKVWFFDTPTLSLKQQELVLRVRMNATKTESTAKWRRWVSPFNIVREAWEQLPGFKAEIDASLTDAVPAWSVTEKNLQKERFPTGKEKGNQVLEFLNSHQRLLVESAWPGLPWEELITWGPIASTKWEIIDDIVIERWTIGQESVIEVSKRGEHNDKIYSDLHNFLLKNDIEAVALEGGKTAWALSSLMRLSSR